MYIPWYDPSKTFEDNYKNGPFGPFSDNQKYTNSTDPKETIFGKSIFLPFGIPACPLINHRFIKAAFDKGFDVVTYKTVRSTSKKCYPFPNILSAHSDKIFNASPVNNSVICDKNYTSPHSIANSFGNPSFDPDVWQEDMKKALDSAGKGQLLFASFQGTNIKNNTQEYIQDFATTARLVKETGVEILEVNLSCPNEGKSDLLCFDIQMVPKILESIKNEIGNTPLLIKIAYFRDKDTLRELVKICEPFIDGISSINSIASTCVNKDNEYSFGNQRKNAGVSGKTILSAGIEMTKNLVEIRNECDLTYKIIGIGGVHNYESYMRYKNTGADIVMSATGALFNPYLAQDIKQIIYS
jgi:dihydroorotate dehydrogenase